MEKDDSNGSSFEIIDKPGNDQANGSDRTGSSSRTSTSSFVTSPCSVNVTTGNLLSNVAPPTTLPDFQLWNSPASTAISTESTTHLNTVVTAAPIIVNQFPSPQFSAAIPPNKGIPQEQLLKRTVLIEAEEASSSGFFGFVKDALSSQVVSKMVEKAKSSVDSIITTLDPQMNSDGDLKIIVTSEEEDIIGAIREATYAVFGKAWVQGLTDVPFEKTQAVGFDKAIKNLEAKLAFSLQLKNIPTVAIENVLIKQGKIWHDVSILILRDLDNQINLQTLSQSVPVPVRKFLGPEVADIDIENKLAEYLKNVPCWQEEVSGVTRKEILTLAAKVLFKVYKDNLPRRSESK
ncbi:protein PRRC1-like isoform X2 [Sitophilus oryzae]|uniref:Protein PRRC1-like isoform X2 n=1 Tax=Sitophilus oryzae TaxID=7048 RepID=A0A6J2YMF2_SITOR|nr:protein PRRC1-like isoform X2 [Sitophilus oryzae]